jgi:two-component system chemotaxis sensor kinase CheA
LKATFQKMARLVRDLAYKSGKVVEFHTQGEDTEIDRNMVDFISDPLVHMIRNAIDHGIEAPEVREGRGKSRTGTVRLSAYQAGGNIVVELADDGQGLDRDKILKKGLEKGLLTTEIALGDSEIFALVFAPGFSTADQITDVSGRGVGMDVVRRNVEALRGRIDIASQAGQGSTFTVRLPLTLAITDGVLVRKDQER